MGKNAREKLENAFMQMMENKKINEISIKELTKNACVNRTTFYTHYVDIFDLAEKFKKSMYDNIISLYEEERIRGIHSYDFLKLFEHIKKNQLCYKTIFKLNFDFLEYMDNAISREDAIKYLGTSEYIDYHVRFFASGITEVIKTWLFNGCQESPKEIDEIIKREYRGKIKDK